jgi:type IV secretion system protein VirB10
VSATDPNPQTGTDPAAAPSTVPERGIPPVNPRRYQSRTQLLVLSSGVVLLLTLMWIANRTPGATKATADDPHATQTLRFDEGKPTGVIVPALSVLEPPRPQEPAAGPIGLVPAIDAQGGAGMPGQGPHEPTPLELRMRSKTVLYDAPSARLEGAVRETAGSASSREGAPPGTDAGYLLAAYTAGAASAEGTAGEAALGLPPGRGGNGKAREDEHGIGGILRPTRLEGVSAVRFPDRTLMLAQGKIMDCILDTAISTVVAGMVKCTLPRNVYSEDGKLVLLDRGTELTGEYRSNVQVGQARLGVVWARARTPAGVLIDLNSPATDSLGRGGIDGAVDNHFWERYGAALLLSSLDDSLALLVSRANNNQVYVPTQTTHTGQDAAAVALGANIQIPPTIVVNQGEHIAVFVARDLDFRPVYTYRAPPGAAAHAVARE